MLEKFGVSNFKGFKEEIVLDLSNVREYQFNDELIRNNIVNKAIIYGENGSGKSNLGLAIFDIISNLTDKNKSERLYKNYLNAESDKEYAEFKYNFVINKKRIEYIYKKKSLEEILEEELKIDGKTVIKYNFRDDQELELNLKGAESLNRNIENIAISAVKYVYRNTVLEKNDDNEAFKGFIEFVERMLYFRCLDDKSYIGFENGTNNIIKDIITRDKVEDFQKFLNDAGVKCSLKAIEESDEKKLVFNFGKKDINFFEVASTGTKSLTLLYYWFIRIEEASFVFDDEFDAFYHFQLSKTVINKLRKKEAQIIFTTHNTAIMRNNLLRPDCCFDIVDGEIKSLADRTSKELRKAHNIEKIYRTGGFNE